MSHPLYVQAQIAVVATSPVADSWQYRDVTGTGCKKLKIIIHRNPQALTESLFMHPQRPTPHHGGKSNHQSSAAVQEELQCCIARQTDGLAASCAGTDYELPYLSRLLSCLFSSMSTTPGEDDTYAR
jgi:hypothetical protein